MFLRPFGFRVYCSACFGILFVSILCTFCSHFSWYCFTSVYIYGKEGHSVISQYTIFTSRPNIISHLDVTNRTGGKNRIFLGHFSWYCFTSVYIYGKEGHSVTSQYTIFTSRPNIISHLDVTNRIGEKKQDICWPA